jgi:hypothetical protein
MMERVNSTVVYCKNFCKCHNVPPVQQWDDNLKILKKKKIQLYIHISWLRTRKYRKWKKNVYYKYNKILLEQSSLSEQNEKECWNIGKTTIKMNITKKSLEHFRLFWQYWGLKSGPWSRQALYHFELCLHLSLL